ncbi:acyl carrier protein [Streptomyces bambusae]|uniref:acyl carrier protein n=1 Tax=Streptomyces bambusae TaxID=1550616 RepID=UPI001CFCE0AD|nr:acyl carrier protein [Streptomyces bambusae]MCB5164183.1 acyl carrier protein [Streptomyces bambusae]
MEEVITWIRSKHPDLEGDIAWDTDLIESRLIASVSFLEFIALLEELSGERIDVGSLSVGDFRTLGQINERFLAKVA